jgi:hypothetical protein
VGFAILIAVFLLAFYMYDLIVSLIFYIYCVVVAFAIIAAILLFIVAILCPLLIDFYYRTIAVSYASGLNELFTV